MYRLRTDGKRVFITIKDIIAYSNFLDSQQETDLLTAAKNRITKRLKIKGGKVI